MANYMQVVARTMDANVINFCIEVVFTAVMAYLLSSFLGGSGVWTAYATAQAELSLFLVLRLLLSKDPVAAGLRLPDRLQGACGRLAAAGDGQRPVDIKKNQFRFHR